MIERSKFVLNINSIVHDMALKKVVLFFVLLALLAIIGEARHTHPRSELWAETTDERVIDLNDYGRAETEVIDIKPKNLSPLSSILFFKSYDPCEEGFKLDFQGVCREVWF